MKYTITSYGISHVGLVRSNNEDVWDLLDEKNVYFLADGMGGHSAGEVAAQESINELRRWFIDHYKEPASPQEALFFLKEAFLAANDWVHLLSKQEKGWHGMGTTICCAWIIKETLIYAHVGDSRIYRFSKDRLDQLTQDHSLRQEFISKGYSPLPSKNIITRSIGITAHVEPDVGTCPVKAGEIYFLCSDGLSDTVSSSEMQQILLSSKNIEEASCSLVQAAIDKGGNDNITLVMISCVDETENLPRQQRDNSDCPPCLEGDVKRA